MKQVQYILNTGYDGNATLQVGYRVLSKFLGHKHLFMTAYKSMMTLISGPVGCINSADMIHISELFLANILGADFDMVPFLLQCKDYLDLYTDNGIICSHQISDYSEFVEEGDPSEVAGNVEESTEMVEDQKQAVVGFSHTDTVQVTEKKTAVEPVSQGMHRMDAELVNFFKRPVLLERFTWDVGSDIGITVDPWVGFLDNGATLSKIDYYHLCKFDLTIQIAINGSPFHYGKILIAYIPFSQRASNGHEYFTALTPDQQRCYLSQKPHVIIDASNDQVTEMKLPYFNTKPWFEIPGNVLDFPNEFNIGEIIVYPLQPLRVANDNASNQLDVTFWVWSDNFQLSMPTSVDLFASSSNLSTIKGRFGIPRTQNVFIPEGDEKQKDGFLTRMSSALADVAGIAAEKPIAAPFALPTQLAMKAANAAFSVLGWSKPLDNSDEGKYVRRLNDNLATTAGKSMAFSLAVDPNQELTVDTRTAGLDGKDELTISTITKTPSIIYNAPWTSSDLPNTTIWKCNVTPTMAHQFVNVPTSTSLTMSSLAYASLPFQFWTGTLIYRIQIVASQYHRGRLRITYEPDGAAFGDDSYNTTYSQIIDINENKDIEFAVPWCQGRSYKQLDTPTAKTQTTGTDSLPPRILFNNGRIYITVVNQLNSPLITADVNIVVWIKAGDDFRLLAPAPDDTQFTFNALSPDPGVLPIRQFVPGGIPNLLSAKDDVIDQSDNNAGNFVEEGDAKEESNSDPSDVNKPLTASKVIQLIPPPNNEFTNNLALVHGGEQYFSFRNLLKRAQYSHSRFADIGSGWSTPVIVQSLWSSVFPPKPGYGPEYADTSYAASTSTPISGTNGAVMTLLQYLAYGYCGWRGSLRWTAVPSTNLNDGEYYMSRAAQPLELDPQFWNRQTFIAPTVNEFDKLNRIPRDMPNAWGGTNITNIRNQKVLPVDVPFYSSYQFKSADMRRYPKPNSNLVPFTNDDSSTAIKDTFVSTSSAGASPAPQGYLQISKFVSTGEDFDLLWYKGAPIFFLNSTT